MTREDVAKLIRMNFTLYKLGAKPLTDEEMETFRNALVEVLRIVEAA